MSGLKLLELLSLLDCLTQAPVESIPLRRLEKVYKALIVFFMENNAEMDENFIESLSMVIQATSHALEYRKKKLPRLSEHLIKNPSEVEQILSRMTLHELMAAEKSGLKKIRCPQLRQQFSNMVTRCIQNIYIRADLPSC